jgi:hypothetical protein
MLVEINLLAIPFVDDAQVVERRDILITAPECPLEQKVGAPPSSAECLPVCTESAQTFFGSLHCMLQVNGGAAENWPRSGLEAMASGVPIVAENRWGWRELIRHGETGYLCENDDELAYYAARLAYDENHRLEMAHRARRSVEDDLAAQERIWAGWLGVFRQLAG